MRGKRSERDMFGRPAARAPAPVKEPRVSVRQRPIPPGLVPFIPVLAIIVLLIAFLVEPVVGIALVVVIFAAIIRLRYRQVKDVDYVTLRRADPLYRGWNDFMQGRNRYKDPDEPSP